MDERYIDSVEIAAYLHTDVEHVRAMCRNKQLPHIRIGGKGQIRSKRSWIDNALREQDHGSVQTVQMLESQSVRSSLVAEP